MDLKQTLQQYRAALMHSHEVTRRQSRKCSHTATT
jgi:hypothetical protein